MAFCQGLCKRVFQPPFQLRGVGIYSHGCKQGLFPAMRPGAVAWADVPDLAVMWHGRRAVGQQCCGTEPAAPGGQPQNQQRHPLSPRHRLQVDPRLPLRNLARPGPRPPPVLPATTHFPLTLNCYPQGSFRASFAFLDHLDVSLSFVRTYNADDSWLRRLNVY